MRRRGCGLVAALVLAWPVAAPAQSYPNRVIKIIVPFTPGSPVDATARVVTQHLQPRIGQNFIIENRAGGGTSIGVRAVATAQPDGYTLLLNGSSTVYTPSLYPSADDEAVRKLMPISPLVNWSHVIVVAPTLPVRNLQELIAYAKANPGKLSYGSAGAGTLTNLAGELFKQLIGAPDIVHIPYKGAAPGIADLASGHIPMMTPNVGGPLIEFHRAGKVRILAVNAPTRIKAAPDIPTAIEAGLPDMIAGNLNGLFAPAGLANRPHH
jgi:tripartite-type tricarboxylate transporter receptor subunit TctC